ncbi:MAG: lipopolysaccharide biosynthesis protein, partial [Synechococcales cyanobacterium T60_A2020_003]|nr:lipopolysaccharide biosynthesis protein [Synechococcales cyanobacterium T60_A2020_003]
MEPNHLQNQQYFLQYSEEIDFQKYWLVLKRRWLPAAGVLSTVVAMSTLYALTQNPSYEATGKLLIRTDRSSALTGVAPGSNLGQVTTLYAQNNPLDTQAEILKSIPVVAEAIEALDLRDDEGERVKPSDAIRGLGVKSVPGTDVLQVSYESTDPDLAAAVVNAVMESYIHKNIANNRAETIAARKFIQQQLPIAEDAVNDAEIALRNFKESNQIVALDQEATSIVTTIANLENQIAQTQANLVSATAQSLELRRQVGMNPEQAVNLSRLK